MSVTATPARPWNRRARSASRAIRRAAAAACLLAGTWGGIAFSSASLAAAEPTAPAPPPLGVPSVSAPASSANGSSAHTASANNAAPKLAEGETLRVRLANRPQRRASGGGTWEEVETVPAAAPRQVPESYRAADEARQFTADQVTVDQKPIGLSIINAAATEDEARIPENFAAEVLRKRDQINVTNSSRYREDFAVPVDLSAAEFAYRPLYFEEVNLERYGTSHGAWQPIMSGARFFATIPAMPYLATVKRPCVPRYWPHYFQAGRCAPFREPESPPFDLEAGGVEGLAIYGLILLIP